MSVDKSDLRVKSMFAAIAVKYDRMNHLLSLNVDRYWRWRAVRMLPSRRDEPILDVCTGTGDLAFAFWHACRGRVPVIGTDFCREMLRIGEEKRTRFDAHGALRFVEADTQALPFPSDQFQIVSVAFGLRNVNDTDRGLQEMVRVCRDGGKVAVLEFSEPAWQPFKLVYGWYFRHVLPRIGQLLAANNEHAYVYLPQSVGEFPAGAALNQRMRAAGLREVRHYRLTLGIATLHVGTK